MIKQPYIPFYTGDWMQDTRSLSLAGKGAWIDILCGLHRSQTRGSLTLPVLGWARLIGATVDQALQVISELVDMRTCDSVTERNGEITLINRRMIKEEKERISNTERQKRYRNKLCNGENNGDIQTSSLSSSFALSDSEKNRFLNFTEDQNREIKIRIAKTKGMSCLSEAVDVAFQELIEQVRKQKGIENPYAYVLAAAQNPKSFT